MQQVSEFRVRYAETDQMGVVYHANYLVWCEVGRTDLLRTLGKSYSEVEKSGLVLAVAEASLRFKRAARYDELIRVVTKVRSVRSRAVTFDYEIFHDSGTHLVSASTVLVSIGPDGRSVVLPSELRLALEGAIEG